MTRAFTDIPFSLDADNIIAQSRVEPGSDDAADLLSLIETAGKIAKPKAAYTECSVTARDGDEVRVDGVWFRSLALARKLHSAERVFAIVASCGKEMDDGFSADGDFIKDYWWDLIKTRLLNTAARFLKEYLCNTYGLTNTGTMRPGSDDAELWPIEQQRGLFHLLDGVEEELGIRLTESCLMIPNKTTSGILFPVEQQDE